ncbi:MAG: tripartite tricarboxylate transporter substrate binding protein [Rubrivivax sp.]|nr:MAG: tripartite tricarboxylate transporter substrate binding protein [Rubrivivax sp.]
MTTRIHLNPTAGSARAALAALGATLAAALWPGAAALAQTDAAGYPDRAIRLIVPNAPGGTNDAVARIVAHQLELQLKKPLVVENRPGANGLIGYAAVANAAPDGYTIMHTPPSLMINEFVSKDVRYGMKDFTPITNISLGNGYLIVTNTDGPIKTLADLKAAASTGKGLTYGSAGLGNTTQLASALLGARLGVEMLHVPFKGIADAMNAVVAGNVDVVSATPISALPFVKSGRLRAIAFTGAQRWSELPDIPTVAESYPGFEVIGAWLGWFGPKNMPPAITARLQQEIAKALQVPAVREAIEKGGQAPDGRSPEEFRKFLAVEEVRYRDAVKAAKITPQ